ncbi:hypothetical protein SDC9_78881 [bioreactor metagenome]|uniref:Uncharacterized protein n=1 Tax=bioreactor metagenome TaxID=1076179 RepID=A0A644YVF6_9ZZZZ
MDPAGHPHLTGPDPTPGPAGQEPGAYGAGPTGSDRRDPTVGDRTVEIRSVRDQTVWDQDRMGSDRMGSGAYGAQVRGLQPELSGLRQVELGGGQRVVQRVVGAQDRQAEPCPSVPQPQVVAARFLVEAGGDHPLLQPHRVDDGGLHPDAPQPATGRLEEARLQPDVMGQQHPAGQPVEELFDRRGERCPLLQAVVGEPVHRGALAHPVLPQLRPGDDDLPGAAEPDDRAVHRHPADAEDPVLARVETGGLHVHRQQRQLGQRGPRRGLRSGEIGPQRPLR